MILNTIRCYDSGILSTNELSEETESLSLSEFSLTAGTGSKKVALG